MQNNRIVSRSELTICSIWVSFHNHQNSVPAHWLTLHVFELLRSTNKLVKEPNSFRSTNPDSNYVPDLWHHKLRRKSFVVSIPGQLGTSKPSQHRKFARARLLLALERRRGRRRRFEDDVNKLAAEDEAVICQTFVRGIKHNATFAFLLATPLQDVFLLHIINRAGR